jgi:F0F1-type ATP synthase epsilon subunit
MADRFKPTFKCTIISPNRVVFEREVESVFLTGDRGEYELLAYHYPLLGVLLKSDVVIDGKEAVSINGGVVRFFANECTIMVEEPMGSKKQKK